VTLMRETTVDQGLDTRAPGAIPSVFDDGDAYDLMVGSLDFGLDFYFGLAREARGPVLDVACGTGRILLPCLAEGIDIEGVDLFEPMLRRLRAKAAEQGLSPRLHRADMSEFSIDRKFALVMIPFNAFIHNMTQAAQIRCLSLCREHLVPGGVLAFDTFFPCWEIVGAPAGMRAFEGEMPHPVTGLPMRMYDTRTFDRVAQTQHSLNEFEILAADGSVESVIRTECSSRYIFKHEMELLLRVAGFARWEIYGDFERRPLTRENDQMIVMAWNG
jgi:SAM-dependent methyltransferase